MCCRGALPVLCLWGKKLCLVLTFSGIVTSVPLLILCISGQYLEKAPLILGWFFLIVFLIFGIPQCCQLYYRERQTKSVKISFSQVDYLSSTFVVNTMYCRSIENLTGSTCPNPSHSHRKARSEGTVLPLFLGPNVGVSWLSSNG